MPSFVQKMENKNMDDDITANLIGRHQNANKNKVTQQTASNILNSN